MRPTLIRATLSLLLVLGLAAACVPPGTTPAVVAANPNPPPPPVRTEVIPKPPVSEEPLIWEPGHWDWDGSGYAWREGEWIKRAGHGTAWQDGYWTNQNGSWAWLPAHWM